MAWQTFATKTSPNPMSTLDTQFGNVAQWSIVGCTATGTNVVTLTPILSGYTGPAYANFVAYSFIAANSSSGAVTLKVGSLAALNVYKSDGTTQIGSGDIVAAQTYRVFYNGALNSSAGGWYLENVGVVPQSLTGVTQSAPGGRLSLVTATPVMTTTQSAKTSIFYCLYNSSLVPYWTGSAWATDTFAELSLALDSNAGHTGYQQSGKTFDIFYDHNAGSGRIVSGPAWTNATTRADALARLNGIWVNNASIVVRFDTSASTATIAANLLTYLGTMLASADGQCQFIYGAVAANGTAGAFNLWNCYNRVGVPAIVGDTTNSWTYSTATWRAANNSATMRVTYVCGLSEDPVIVDYNCSSVGTEGVAGAGAAVGVDATNAFSGSTGVNSLGLGGGSGITLGQYAGVPGLGTHFVSAIEYCTSGTVTFYGDAGTAYYQNALRVQLRM